MPHAEIEAAGPIDAHVHIVGNGSSGSGCWLRPKGWRRWLVPFLLRGMGLPPSALETDLDRLYVECLLDLVRGSSLRAVVILAQDLARDDSGRPLPEPGIFYVPNDYVLRLAKQHAEFLPAVSIHPAVPDALVELERAIAAGAVMMKCLPNARNIDCNDRRFQPFWEKMAESGLPLLAHTGGETTLPMVRKELAHPRVLTLPLKCGVNVIAAHCATRSGLRDPQYFDEFAAMAGKFINLYGDLSAFNTPFRGSRVRDCLREPLLRRMIHGSDAPVPVHGVFAFMRRQVSLGDFFRCARQKNPLERDYCLKRAMKFPPATFSRAWNLFPSRSLPASPGQKKPG